MTESTEQMTFRLEEWLDNLRDENVTQIEQYTPPQAAMESFTKGFHDHYLFARHLDETQVPAKDAVRDSLAKAGDSYFADMRVAMESAPDFWVTINYDWTIERFSFVAGWNAFRAYMMGKN